MSAAMVVVAAGVGARLGSSSSRPKALVDIDGRPLLAHTLDRVVRVAVDDVVVVHTPGEEAAFATAVAGRARLVPGGRTRSESVRAGVAATASGHAVVAIHDAARAFMPAGVMQAALDAVRGAVVAAAPVIPVADTLKEVQDGRVVGTVDRSHLWAVQTPQVVARVAWDAVLDWAGDRDATDDLGLVEEALSAGAVDGEIRLVAGSRLGWKITWPEDLELATALAARRRSAPDAVEARP